MYAYDNVKCKMYIEVYKKNYLLKENELYRLIEIKNKKKRGQ